MPEQNDSLLGMLSNYLGGQWSARAEETGRPMGVQNLAALAALDFLKPPPVLDESGAPNPEALERFALGGMAKKKALPPEWQGKIPVEEVLKRFKFHLQHEKNLYPNTVDAYMRDIKKYLDYLFQQIEK